MSFDNLETITFDNYNQFDKIAGIWLIFDNQNNLIDIHETNNIGKEFVSIINKIKSNSGMWSNIYRIGINNLHFKLFCYNNNQSERQKIEFELARKYKPKFWYPSTTQAIILRNFMYHIERNNNEKHKYR